MVNFISCNAYLAKNIIGALHILQIHLGRVYIGGIYHQLLFVDCAGDVDSVLLIFVGNNTIYHINQITFDFKSTFHKAGGNLNLSC